MERLLLRVREAAEIAGIAKSTAYALVASGEWPSVRIGRRGVRIPVDALRDWVESQTVDRA